MHNSSIKVFKNSRTIEQLNSLYVRIVQCCQGKKNMTILVASCNEREGTTTIAVNLCHVIAQNYEQNILFIDVNERNSNIKSIFNSDQISQQEKRISLKDESHVLVKKTQIANVAILTAKSSDLDSATVLDSQAIKQSLEHLKNQYSLIIIDSLPVIPFSDSLYLCSAVDFFLLVIQAEKTRWEVAQEALQRISAAKVRTVGTILNKKKARIPSILYKHL